MPNKQRNFSLWKKYKIVNQINSGTNVLKLTKELKISRSSMQTILRNKNKIICEFESGHKTGIKRKHQ